MNEVVPYPAPKAPAADTPKSTTRAEQVAVTLRRIDEKLIAPRERVRDLLKEERLRSAHMIAKNADEPFERVRAMLLAEDGEWHRERLRHDLATFPSPDELRPHLTFVEQALVQPVNRAQNRLLLGMMADAFPNTRAHAPETYFEQVAFQVERDAYPPVVVACATQEAVRRKTFLPSLAEVLDLCRDEHEELQHHRLRLHTAMRAAEWLAMASEALDAYEAGERTPAPPKPISQPWTPGDPIPFGDDEPSREDAARDMAREMRQLVRQLGRRR